MVGKRFIIFQWHSFYIYGIVPVETTYITQNIFFCCRLNLIGRYDLLVFCRNNKANAIYQKKYTYKNFHLKQFYNGT